MRTSTYLCAKISKTIPLVRSMPRSYLRLMNYKGSSVYFTVYRNSLKKLGIYRLTSYHYFLDINIDINTRKFTLFQVQGQELTHVEV